MSDFRKEWLDFDFAWLTEPGDGIVKPSWNKGITLFFDFTIAAPSYIKSWSVMGWEKLSSLANDSAVVVTESSKKSTS